VQKVLARAGVASRRGAEALIAAGRVTIGGRRAVLGDRIAPDDELRVDGRIVESAAEHRTFALHKPRGVVTSAADERGRRTVLDLLPAVAGLHPVGRLDLDSEGLLLLTTDGELTLRLTHPRYGHTKTYRVWCLGGSPDAEALSRLRDGVLLDDGWARADDVRPAAGGAVIVLREGRKRQVRRMLAAVAAPVERLVRTHVGAIALGDLPAGGWRELGAEEVERLRYTRGDADRDSGTAAGRRTRARRRHP
jgi:23S rRNA pseudouridine2605 synthase